MSNKLISGKEVDLQMNDITLLDCTLRDGGYINDWMFGCEEIKNIVRLVGESRVEYIEIGFIKLGQYNQDQAQFNHIDQLTKLLYPTEKKLAAMVEIGYGYPVKLFPKKSEKTPAMIRVISWKRLINESFVYCSELIKKGYEVCIQLTRTDQYTESEFIESIKLFNKLDLKGLYIVDTFGLFTKDMLLKYFSIADDTLRDNIAIGYHAHNNMQQAFSNSCMLAEIKRNHNIMIDASILGIGRGAGNLNIEIFMKYLNDKYNYNYDINPILQAANDYIIPIYEKTPWGYSLLYYLSAVNNINPSYVAYIKDKKLTIGQVEKIFKKMNECNIGIVYDIDAIDKIIADEIK
jgi:4-hydroxy 2-oxovalerate aldolase